MHKFMITSNPAARARSAASAMYDTFLHPDAASSHLNSGIDDSGHELWTTKYIDDVDRHWNILQSLIAFFAEYLGYVRVHRDDLVADRFKIFSYMVACAHAVVRESHDRNRFAGI